MLPFLEIISFARAAWDSNIFCSSSNTTVVKALSVLPSRLRWRRCSLVSSGVLLSKIGISLFDTAAYKKAAEKAYEWRQKGYVDPEGSAQTLTHDVLSQSGACKGVYMGHAYSVPTIEQMFTMNNTYGATFKAVSIGKTSLTSNRAA